MHCKYSDVGYSYDDGEKEDYDDHWNLCFVSVLLKTLRQLFGGQMETNVNIKKHFIFEPLTEDQKVNNFK